MLYLCQLLRVRFDLCNLQMFSCESQMKQSIIRIQITILCNLDERVSIAWSNTMLLNYWCLPPLHSGAIMSHLLLIFILFTKMVDEEIFTYVKYHNLVNTNTDLATYQPCFSHHMKEGSLSWSYFYLKNTPCPLRKFGFSLRYIIRT